MGFFLIFAKGGLVSKSYSFWLKFSDKGVKITLLSTLQLLQSAQKSDLAHNLEIWAKFNHLSVFPFALFLDWEKQEVDSNLSH